MNTIRLPQGETLPSLGLGTWRMGESASRRKAEVAALRLGLELGYRVIDTAEMYGEGGAEEVVGQALAQALREGSVAREQLFIVSKAYPHNASVAERLFFEGFFASLTQGFGGTLDQLEAHLAQQQARPS